MPGVALQHKGPRLRRCKLLFTVTGIVVICMTHAGARQVPDSTPKTGAAAQQISTPVTQSALDDPILGEADEEQNVT